MTDLYPYHEQFRLKLAALAVDPVWTNKVGRIIKPAYFETDAERVAMQAIYDYKDRFGKIPQDVDDVLALVVAEPDAVEVVRAIFDVADDFLDMELPKEIALQWAKEQAVKIAILDSIDDIKSGNLKAPLEKMEAALSVGEELPDVGIDVVDDVGLWLYELWIDKIATGWYHMDMHLEGGLGAGELGVILAPTNRGKSIALVNIAYGAAGIGSGKNVLIATHEMNATLYAKRVAARMMFRFPQRNERLSGYEEEFLDLAMKLLPGNIKVIGGPKTMSVNDLQDSVEILREEGFEPDIIIDDYADLLEPPRQYKEKRFEMTATYKWLRAFGGELNCPVWTASQVGRQAYTREVIRLEDIAEDIGKANTADLIVAICQTPEEYTNERCRLYMAKVRDAKHGRMYDAKYYVNAQAIITIGETEQRDVETV